MAEIFCCFLNAVLRGRKTVALRCGCIRDASVCELLTVKVSFDFESLFRLQPDTLEQAGEHVVNRALIAQTR